MITIYVWMFQGNLGDGKTFGASVIAHYFKERAKKAHVKVDMYSNYGLKGSRELKHYTDFYDVAKSENSIVLLDEAHINLDSRLFSRGSNIYMTQFFFYLRKLRSSLFMTSPNIRNLDSRVRQLTNILVDCHKRGGGFAYDIYDYSGEKLLKKLYMPPQIAKEIFKVGLYDTHSIVRNVTFPSNERAFDDFLDKVVKARDEAFAYNKDAEDQILAEALKELPDEMEELPGMSTQIT